MGKLINIDNLDKLSKALDARYKELINEEKARAIDEEEALQSEIDITKEMFDGKSIKYVSQAEYDALTEEERNSNTITYFIIDAEDLSHEHENKEFLDGLSQEVLDNKVDKEDEGLNTEDKTIVGAINELSSKLIEKEASDYVNVKDLGVIGDGITDVTAALQNVLDANDNVFIPEGVYLINGPAINDAPSDNPDSGLVLHSNQKLLMSDKAILKLIPCSTKNSCVLRIESHCENVVIEGGNIEGDKYEHLGTTGEAGMGIYLSGNTNVVIKNVNISKCWGDGVIINNSKGIDGTELEPSKDIYMYNVVCDDNRRQGMTIVGVDGAVIENCKFINTNGINPQAGVDIEPSPYETNYAKNIEFINCEFSGNARTGLITAINENNGNPTIIENVKFNNCASVNNKENGILVTGGVRNFEINDCYVARNEYDGIHVGAAINCIISNTVSEYNTQQGIYLYNTNECNVVNSHANYNGESGIKLNMASNEIKIFNNTAIGNTINNIHVVNSQNCIISHNISLDSGNNGIYIQDSSEIINDSNFVKDSMVVGLYLQNANRSKIYNNNVIGSSVKTDQNVPNIICVGEYNTIVENTCRIGSNANRPSGGLAIGWYGSSATNNYVFNNDCYNSGTNFGLRDMGTNTITSTNIDLNGELINIHQTKDDETLNTADKTIVGAINELQSEIDITKEMLDEIQMYTNVLTLGVKNDGTEDCTIIINDALNEGKSLYFPKGKYLLEYIELQSYNVLIGENDHETILIPNTTTRKSFMNINKGPCQHVRMENFTIKRSSNIGQICMDFTSRFPDEGYQHGGLWNSIFKNIYIDSANNGWNGVGLLLAGPSHGHNLLPNQLSLFENINIYVDNIENINNIALLIEGQVEQHLFTRCTFSGVDIHNTITDLNNCAVVFRRHTDENGNLDDMGGGLNTFINCYVGNCARGMLFERSRGPVFISTYFENLLQAVHATVVSELTIMNSSLGASTDDYNSLTTDTTGCMVNLINVRGSGNINAMAVNQVCSSGYINTYKDERVMRDEELRLRCPSTILHCQKEEIVIDNISINEILSNANSDIFIYLINDYEGGTLVKFTNEGNILTPLEIMVDKRIYIKCRYIEGFNKFIIELVEDDGNAITLNGYSLWVGTTEDLEAITERDPNTLYFEIDDGSGEEVVQVDIVDGILQLTADKYQKTSMLDGTEIVFPTVSRFTEIHLYFTAGSNMNIILPDNCKWRVEPNIEEDKSYEIIATYNTIEWLVNVIVYS